MVTIVIMLFSVGMMHVWMMARNRQRMLIRARTLLATLSDPDERIEFVRFRFAWPSAKRRAMNSTIEKLTKDGWIYLKATEAPFKKTIYSWGGGLNLHFVRGR